MRAAGRARNCPLAHGVGTLAMSAGSMPLAAWAAVAALPGAPSLVFAVSAQVQQQRPIL